jgi:WD40 repeat protein
VKFSQKELEKRIKGHTSSVTSITASEHGLVTASINDGFVKVWNLQLRCLMSINTRDFGIKHGISAAVWDHNLNTITIGNEGGEIWQLISSDGSITNYRTGPITKSHSPAGLTINPSGYSFATCGDDGLLCFWSIFDNECQTYYDIKSPARACAFSPDGRLMAVGMGNPNKENARVIDGKWVVINIHDGSFQVLAERRDSRKHITNIKWSGSRIAVGSSDSRICVYDISSKTTPATKVELLLLSVIELKSCATHFGKRL